MKINAPACVPNTLTLLGLAAALYGCGLALAGDVTGLWWLWAGQAADVLDGWTARQLGAASPEGAMLDWQADTSVAAVVLVALGAWWLVPAAVAFQVLATRRGIRSSGRAFAVVALTVLMVWP